jgi:hypothetical protein
MMSLNPKRLTRRATYRIDGLGDGVEYPRWTLAKVRDGVVTFHGPRREQCVLAVERLYEVRAGHLHYASVE